MEHAKSAKPSVRADVLALFAASMSCPPSISSIVAAMNSA
jgi:hypothetical protein